MRFDELAKLIDSCEQPVILLEGSRTVLEKDAARLTRLAAKLAQKFPRAIFRSGGASGSDTLFAEGINQTNKNQLQLVLPTSRNLKTGNSAIKTLRDVCFEQTSETEQKEIFKLTEQATPDYRGLIEFYQQNKKGKLFFKTQYLLRDTLKVIGSETLQMSRASVGCFYVNSNKASGGGTGHTIRVCRLLQVPVIEQKNWLNWF